MPTMNRSVRTMISLATIVLSAAGGAVAGPGTVAYDGFGNGPRQQLDGSSGGEGWAGPWIDTGASIITSSTEPVGGLVFGDLEVMPGYATTPGGWLPDMTDYSRSYPAIAGDAM